jgi:Mrp family chromosome partitioning ATPase
LPEVTSAVGIAAGADGGRAAAQRRFASATPTLIGDAAKEAARMAAQAIFAVDRERAKEAARIAASSAPAPEDPPPGPPSRPRRRRAGSGGTLMMGSFAAPDARERTAPISKRAPPVSDTTYRYSSAPPPGAEPAPREAEKTAVNILRAPPGWQPDRSLLLPLHESLREQLYTFAVERSFCVLVSCMPDAIESKSRVAAGLALALAETNHPRILLVEGNFHRPAVQRLMQVEVPVTLGFSQQLHARIRPRTDGAWHVVGCTPSLHVLGESIMRSPGMILSKQFEASMRDLRKYYDVIIIDGPDTSFEFDCRALDSVADGLAFVCHDSASPELEGAVALFSGKRFATTIVAPVAAPPAATR